MKRAIGEVIRFAGCIGMLWKTLGGALPQTADSKEWHAAWASLFVLGYVIVNDARIDKLERK